MRARTARRWLLTLALVGAVPLATGCDVVFALILAPFFPGKPLPPPDDLVCPLALAAPAELPPMPETFAPALPTLEASCDVGTKTLHRLNRFELDNTLRDLTGQDLEIAATSFPPDDGAAGFDNNADVLAMSPLLVEKLEDAARVVVETAMRRPGEVSETHQIEAETAGVGTGGQPVDSSPVYQIGRDGDVTVQAILPNAAGTYAVRVRVGASADAKDPQVALLVDGDEKLRTSIHGTVDDMQLVETRLSLGKGPVHTLGARFPHSDTAKNGGGGTLSIDFFEVEGPLVVTELGPDPAPRKSIVTCDLTAGLPCAREVVGAFARRAWRRPLEDGELDRLQAFLVGEMRAGDPLEDALRSTLSAVLLSPHFLFRVERDPDLASTAPHALTDHELATRLAYFLWSAPPDARLSTLADEGALQDPQVLEGETRRMLDDPKSIALVKSFAGQWLFTRAVESAAPDAIRFPQFDETLRSAMACETELTFDRFLRDASLDMRDIVTTEDTFVNERLAKHYGLEPPAATLDHGWGLASTVGTGRAGVLTNASLLTVTSQPTRTSPTKRGKWVLDNLLCMSPPSPPPGVEGLPEPAQGEETESVRDRLQQHASSPFCASCHSTIDPFGFGLEHFDGIGRWRASDAGFAIDDSALYMDNPNAPFRGSRELAQHIHDDPQLPFCMTQKTMTYALGKGLDDIFCNVDDIHKKFADSGYKMSELIIAIVDSPSFRMRRAEALSEVTP